MVRVIPRRRQPPVLKPSKVPCLRRIPTINITQGCAHGCVYCYIQGYSQYPGPGRMIVYRNTPEMLRAELRRKRRLPRRVYFSPSSDAFQYCPEVQNITFEAMSILMDAGIEITFLTKGFIRQRFLRLFETRPDMVFAQVGLTTLDRGLWKTLEPRTARPDQRIAYLRALIGIGVATTVRLDPLIPNLTDTEANLRPVLAAVREAGVTDVAAGFLFLRPAFAPRLLRLVQREGGNLPAASAWEYQRFFDGTAGARLLTADERAARFARVSELGAGFGLRVTGCGCKDPRLGPMTCLVAGGPPAAARVATFQTTFAFADERP